MSEKHTFVLVHGAWHTSWVWGQTRAALADLGYQSVVVDLPSCGTDAARLGSLADDAAAVEQAVAAIDGQMTVVAHSYGGVVVTQAELPHDATIIFLSGYVPELGQSLVTTHKSDGAHNAELRRKEGVLQFIPARARDVFYNDLSDEAAAEATARLVLQKLQSVATPVNRVSWPSHRSSYIVSTEDHSIPVEVQQMFAARTGEVRELASSHSGMLSQPIELARLLVELK